jgi:hypothetical protein
MPFKSGATPGHNSNDEIGKAAQSASMDTGDDEDDGAMDGPRVSAYVDLSRRIGKWIMHIFVHLVD